MSASTPNAILTGPLIKAVSMLAGPMLISSVLQNAQSLIDLFWVGRLGHAAVAALALSGTLLMIMFPVVLGLAMGTVALVSRHVGADERDRASDTAGQAILAAGVLGMILGAAAVPAVPGLIALFQVEPEVAVHAEGYLRISLLGAFSVFILFVGDSALRGAGQAVIPMYIMLLTNAINLVLDPWFIFGGFGLPRMGVDGAAAATVVAQVVGCVIVMAILIRGRHGLHINLDRCRPDPRLAWRLFRIGVPSTFQMAARSVMALVLMRIVTSLGTAAVAAYGIGLRLHMLILMPAFALGNAAATLVGQNLGAGQPDRAARGAWLAAVLDGALMIVAAFFLFAFAPGLIAAFNRDPEVVRTGTAMLRIVSPFFVFVALAVVLSRGLQGAGDTLTPMIITLIALWGIQIPVALWLTARIVPPVNGVFWSMSISFVVHGILISASFVRGRWKTKVL